MKILLIKLGSTLSAESRVSNLSKFRSGAAEKLPVHEIFRCACTVHKSYFKVSQWLTFTVLCSIRNLSKFRPGTTEILPVQSKEI